MSTLGQKGTVAVLAGEGLVTVLERYVATPTFGTDPEVLLDLRMHSVGASRGTVEGFPESTFLRNGRPLMSRSTAMQVLAILADVGAPVRSLQPRLRYRLGEEVLRKRDPIPAARFLRELTSRAEGRGKAPHRIPVREQMLRARLVQALGEELDRVLGSRTDQVPYTQRLKKIMLRLNPQPERGTVEQYVRMYKDKTSSEIAALFQHLQRAAKNLRKARTVTGAGSSAQRASITAQQVALLRILDGRGPA